MEKRLKLELDMRISVSAIIVVGGKVLLLKRSPDLVNFPGEWSFPGGRIEDEDQSSFEAALREIEEETNINVYDDYGFFTSHQLAPVYDVENRFAVQGVIIKTNILNHDTFLHHIPVRISGEYVDFMWCPVDLVLNVLTEGVPMSRKIYKDFLKTYWEV